MLLLDDIFSLVFDLFILMFGRAKVEGQVSFYPIITAVNLLLCCRCGVRGQLVKSETR